MASIDELLNDLTNKELRSKCLEYGLPDVPVTNTSRTVLIRRLKAARTGELPRRTTNKRETMHVTPVQTVREQQKPSKQSPKLQKRHTVAAAEPLTNSRRNIRDSDVTVEDVYDDDNDYYARNNNHSYQSNNSYASNDSHSDTSSRRSVSLSKSGVLTTSFVTETVPVRKYDEEMDVDEDATDEDDEADTEEDEWQYHNRSPNVSANTHNNNPRQQPRDNHYNRRDFNENRKQEGNNPYHYSDEQYSPNGAFDEPARYSYAATDVQRTLPKLRQTHVQNLNISGVDDYATENNNDILYRNTAAENAAISYSSNSPPLYPFDMLNSTASSAAIDEPATRPYLRQSVTTGSTANVTRTPSDPYADALKRSLYYTPATAPNQLHKRVSFNSKHTAYDEDAVDYEEEDYEEEEENDVGEEYVGAQHYVSNFARNLENSSSPIDGQVYRPKARRSLEKQRADDNSVMRAAHDFFRTIDNKYHITRYLSITAVFLIVLFILVCIFA